MSKDRNNKKGFTLAEVLITLTIIGVVAALTIPSLLANVSDKTYDAKRKGLATRMAQAISQIGMLNAYEAKLPSGETGSAVTYAEENSSMNFAVEALSKVYKISNICELEKSTACDFPDKYGRYMTAEHWITTNYSKFSNLNSYANATTLGGLDTKGVALKTKNGESMLLYYNPRCVAEQSGAEVSGKNIANELCVHIIYDLDGAKKGANIIGQDMGHLSVFYPDTPYVVMASPILGGTGGRYPSYTADNGDFSNSESLCQNWTGVRGYNRGEWALPSKQELISWGFMKHLMSVDGYAWTTSIEGSGPNDYGWLVNPATLSVVRKVRSALPDHTWCVIDKS